MYGVDLLVKILDRKKKHQKSKGTLLLHRNFKFQKVVELIFDFEASIVSIFVPNKNIFTSFLTYPRVWLCSKVKNLKQKRQFVWYFHAFQLSKENIKMGHKVTSIDMFKRKDNFIVRSPGLWSVDLLSLLDFCYVTRA